MLSKNLEMSLHRALNVAREYCHEYATVEHLLLALSEDPDANCVMRGCGVNLHVLCEKLRYFLNHDLSALVNKDVTETRPTAGFQNVVHNAAINAHRSGKSDVTGANVLTEIFSEPDSYAAFLLMEQNVSRVDLINFMTHGIVKYDSYLSPDMLPNPDIPQDDMDDIPEPPHMDMPSPAPIKESKIASNSALANYCLNLNKLAEEEKVDVLIGREHEIERTIEVLSRRSKNNPLYVGEPGVGKTAIVTGLALRIVRGEVPDALKQAVIFSLDMGSILAGTRYRGDFEERIKNVIREIQEMPHAVLFIDEIHTIIGAGATSGGSLDASNLLKPALTGGDFRCVGSTTFKEYQSHFEKDHALVRRFQKIVIEEPSTEDTIKILKGVKSYYEEHHGVHYTNSAIEAAVMLSQRYVNDKQLPDKAIDVLDEAGARQKLLSSSKKRKNVGVKDVEHVVAKMARIPTKSLSVDDVQRLQHLETELRGRIFGQDGAIGELCAAMKLSRAGLRDHRKPIGCYLFSGPTGVGKTELAKQLAYVMNMELLRFDMSEYMEKHSVARLIGSPPGYVGFEQGGLLTDAVSKSPYTVLLLDEIEKADTDIYNILLQIMDYGKLTDHNGKTVNFRNCVLIMTSNAGAAEMSKAPIGFSRTRREGEDKDAIKRTFTPEFLNRLDAIIPFAPLDEVTVGNIVDKFVNQLADQLADRAVKISVTTDVKDHLAEVGFDNDNGARPLERIIDGKIKKILADEILFGKLTRGGKVTVCMERDDISFSYI